ncbi:endonuclease/exonuclease/phosphatase family protein [Algibacter luteus]|uniref:endonuclease/exonuclease/phosphatase family protein n=1 Tax=Algibacter luteus TaxID=1178825 RepID=UPI00259829B9|nr:endonuclease/exonuclease/phosphatase family protein [Algibacter luteus]WJJ96937.1 endonuclease/exonuclease/phosphatase family protein [Algibacter luteus]
MIRFIKPHLSKINVIVIIALLLIHFVIKESTHFFSLLYYTVPLPLIICAVIFFSFFQNKKIRRYNLILASLLLVVWLWRSFKINTSEVIQETDIEIVFWNATHKRELEDVFSRVENIPDIVVLVEYHAEELDADKLRFPNYFFYWHSVSEIGVFSKKPINIKSVLVAKDDTAIINFETNQLNFYAVDVGSSLNVFRKEQIEFVMKAIKINEKAIVLGDFNLPLESKYLEDIKLNFNNVLTEKGNGFRETWFWNLPLLSIDHIWVSKDLQIVNAEKWSTFKSDHSMIKTVIRD